jgi:hypothetical protein
VIRIAAIALAWLALGLVGCSSMDEAYSTGTTSSDAANLCTTDDDCAEGECSDGMCVAVESAL